MPASTVQQRVTDLSYSVKVQADFGGPFEVNKGDNDLRLVLKEPRLTAPAH